MKYLLTFGVAQFIVYVNALYPRESPTREVKSLNGIWKFLICSQDNQDIGFKEQWFKKSLSDCGDVIPMPVPSSFNDITQNKTIRDYLGWSWYETEFYVPKQWENNSKVILNIGSAHYFAQVYVNGIFLMNHIGGHLPFENEVTNHILYSQKNRLTIALNNTLSPNTIPQGSKTFKDPNEGPYPPGFYTQTTNFDFFNYGGIHRSVTLYAIPHFHIQDILITTGKISNGKGFVNYDVMTQCKDLMTMSDIKPTCQQSCSIKVLNKKGQLVATSSECFGTIVIENVNLWWPYTMDANPGYQYTMMIQVDFVKSSKDIITDIYFQKFGVRTLNVTQNEFLVNNKPFYFTGFGKHEDSDIRGKGLDLPLIIKDVNLIKWIGANSFRTSHYPYSEELMDQADEEGIVVIDECPAVGLTSFTNELMLLHQSMLIQLIARDKNRPSVFAWSVANEPRSSHPEAEAYFKNIVGLVRKLDPTRPISAALNSDPKTDKIGKFMDFIMMNHYFAWYSDIGATEVIYPLLVDYMAQAYSIYKKPIMMSEYGADTIAGLHMDPEFIFTEDYQTELMLQHHRAFDMLKAKGFFIGEHIWNFADFLTQQQLTRVVGNKKGIFTRERQPKASARVLRCRYHKLANKTLSGSTAYCVTNDKICYH